MGDGKIITVGYVNSLNAAVGQPYSKAGVFLFDKEGSVLDSKVIVEDVPRPEAKRGRYSSRATVTYGVCEAKTWYQLNGRGQIHGLESASESAIVAISGT